MSYYTFISYTGSDYSPYMQLFFDDLLAELNGRRVLLADEQMTFFDQEALARGEEWDESLKAALQASKILVPLYSPHYFSSADCGREWRVFQQRREHFVSAAERAGERVRVPPIIKPIMWIPFREGTAVPPDVDRAINVTQYSTGDRLDVSNKEGLNYVIKKFGNKHPAYVDYVKNLAVEILDAADEYMVPAVAHLPPWEEITSAFHPESPDPSEPQTIRPIIGPDHIRFIFVAADPASFGTRRSPDPYWERGRGDWKPFPPYKSENRIFRIVQQIVLDDPLGFTSDEIPFQNDLDLRAEVEKAWRQGQLVILLVDGWTIHWDAKSQKMLEGFDHDNVRGHFYYNCSVIVPWNAEDDDTEIRRAEIEQTIKDTFQFRTNILRNPIYYRDSIRTREELRDALREILTLIRAEIRGKEKVTRPLPAGSDNPSVSVP